MCGTRLTVPIIRAKVVNIATTHPNKQEQEERVKKGWVCLHREVMEHWVFQDSDYWKIWTAMLMKANHGTKSTLFNGALITIERGQFVFGRERFSASLDIPIHVVRRCLKLLKADQMIDQQNHNKYSIISILNYDQYQKFDQQEASKVASKEPQLDQQTATSKQLNNDNNVNKVFSYWQKTMREYNVRLTDSRKKKIQTRLQNYSVEQIIQAINNCALSDYHMGINPQNTKYNDLSLICRSDEKLDQFLARKDEAPQSSGGLEV